MKKRNILLLLIIMFFLTSARKKCSSDIFKNITKSFKSKYGKDKLLIEFEKYNYFVYKKNLLKPLMIARDTIFLINDYSPSSGMIYSMIWNKSDTVSYINDFKEGYSPQISNEMLFSVDALKIIENWDSTVFDMYNLKGGALDAGIMYITRIIFKNNHADIYCYEVRKQFEWSK